MKYLNGGHFKMAPAEVETPGGSGTPAAVPPVGDSAKQLSELMSQNQALAKRLEALEASKGAKPELDPTDLAEKARAERDRNTKTSSDEKALESAINFKVNSKEWLKTNEALLPKTIPTIFAEADKETFESAIVRDSAIKSGIVSEFFSLQSNVDLLTHSQRSALEDFLKLTKNVKQDKAQAMYDQIFEPTFEMLKRIKKAEQFAKGVPDSSSSEEAYKQKLISGSKKRYLGEK